jgi:hypothetical protein
LPKGLKIRVLAADPPIDWTKVKSSDDFLPFLRAGMSFPHNSLRARSWTGSVLNPAPNLAKLIDQASPGKLFTVVRLGGPFRDSTKVESLLPGVELPAFLLLKGTPAGELNANEFIGRDVLVKLFPEAMGIADVADACVYSGRAPDKIIGPNPPELLTKPSRSGVRRSCLARDFRSAG